MARRRPVSSLGAPTLALVLGACASPSQPVSSLSSEIELAQNNQVFALTNTLLAERTRGARFREAAARASGGLLAQLEDEAGQRSLAGNGTPLRSSCGVTFISPSYAVTAASCVDGSNLDLGSLVVEMQRPTPELTQGFVHAAALTGTFPDFRHPELAEADGYHVDRYPCTLRSRCSAGFGGPVNCPGSDGLGSDEALVQCEGAPGSKYGFVEVAAEDDLDAEVLMAWTHEVYDVPLDESDERFQHYVRYTPDRASNYHYFGVDSRGVEQNQLLPLLSANFADGTPHHKVKVEQSSVTTDVFGCHGSFGSGALSPSNHGQWQLLGPFTGGDDETSEYLCDHVPALDGSPRGPGSLGIHYQSLAETQALIAQNQAALASDCARSRESSHSVFSQFACWRQSLAETPENTDFLAHLAAPTHASNLDAWQDLRLPLNAGESVELTAFQVQAGRPYRLGLDAWSSAVCVTDPCPRVEVSVAGQVVLSHTFLLDAEGTVPLAALFLPDASGAVTLSLAVDSGERFELGAISLRPDGDRNDFDSVDERMEATLVDLREPLAPAQPMRFTGDGRDGFSAWLLSEERLVLTRQALPAGRRWSVRFSAPGAQALSCGLLDQAGQVVASADCTSGQVTLDDTAASGEARAGFFIQSSAQSAPVAIDDLGIASDLALDSDQDGLADAVDPCPNGPLPSAGSLQLEFEPAVRIEVCQSSPSFIVLPVPRLLNACEPTGFRGFVSRVNGRELPPFTIELSQAVHDAVLPLGTHEVGWQVIDKNGRVYSTITQSLTIAEVVDQRCCAAAQSLVNGSSSEDAFVLDGASDSCLLLAEGSDFTVARAGSNAVFGGPGADYLRAGVGDDVLDGGDGDDTLIADTGVLTAYGGAGDDTIDASLASSALIAGGPGKDAIVGSSGPDVIYPGADGAWVFAGDGDDRVVLYDACEVTSGLHLFGGRGQDTLISPVSRAALEQAGVELEGFETVEVDAFHGYLSDCFAGN